MRINVVVMLVAAVLMAATFLVGSIYLNDYLGSSEFLQDIFIETLSFIVTVAFIGAGAGAFLHYLQERDARPLRVYAAEKMSASIRRTIRLLAEVLRYASLQEENWDGVWLVVGDASFQRYAHYEPGDLVNRIQAYEASKRDLDMVFERVATTFPVDVRDDLITVANTLEQVEAAVSPIQFNALVVPDSEIYIEVKALHAAAAALGLGLPPTEERVIRLPVATKLRHSAFIDECPPLCTELWNEFFGALSRALPVLQQRRKPRRRWYNRQQKRGPIRASAACAC